MNSTITPSHPSPALDRSAGAPLWMQFRDSLRMCGLPLGPDVLPEMPEFDIPPPPEGEEPWDDEVAIDAGDDPEGDDHE